MARPHAELELSVSAVAEALVAAGTPDRRLHRIVDDLRVRRCRARAHCRRARTPAADRQRAEELAALGVPETIQHDDLHDNRIFVRDDYMRFLDWGDSCVSRPFCSLLIPFDVLEEQGADLRPLADAYLEPFTSFAPRATLAAALPAVHELAAVSRALKWARILAGAPADAMHDFSDHVPLRLRLLLEDA